MAAQEHRPASYPEIREPRQGVRSALQRKSLVEGVQKVVFPSKTAGRPAQISENRCPVAKVRLAHRIDLTMREHAPAGWKGDETREKQVLNALFPILSRNRQATLAVFEIIKNQPGY
jgi:hypothetical protein